MEDLFEAERANFGLVPFRPRIFGAQFHYGALRRSVTLPGTADEEKISAPDNGILELTVPLRGSLDLALRPALIHRCR